MWIACLTAMCLAPSPPVAVAKIVFSSSKSGVTPPVGKGTAKPQGQATSKSALSAMPSVGKGFVLRNEGPYDEGRKYVVPYIKGQGLNNQVPAGPTQ